jgi:hypothetical protein
MTESRPAVALVTGGKSGIEGPRLEDRLLSIH